MNRRTDALSLVLEAVKKQSERRGENVHKMQGVIQDLGTLVGMCQGKQPCGKINNLVALKNHPALLSKHKFA